MEIDDLFDAGFLESMEGNETDPGRVYFIGMFIPRRPGVELFATRLKYEHFPPWTDKNEDYVLRIINWQDMIWIIIDIPGECIEVARKIAEESGIKFADGVPTAISSEGRVQFPLDGENVFTMENLPQHRVYNNIMVEAEALLAEEDAQIDKVVNNCERNRKNMAYLS